MKRRVFLFEWDTTSAQQRAKQLRAEGWTVSVESEDGARGGTNVLQQQPDVVVFDLAKRPSHSRASAAGIRGYKAGRTIPMVVSDGTDADIAKTKTTIANPMFTTSETLLTTINQFQPFNPQHQLTSRKEFIMGAPVMWWEINSNNAAGLQEFYANLFGWSVNANNPMHYGIVSTGSKTGIGGGIGQNDPSMSTPPSVTFYVEVPDLQAMLDKAESLGATTIMPVTEIPNMVTLAMFRDPEGNTIGMIKSQAPPPKAKKAAKKKAPAKKKAVKAKAKKARRR